MPCSSKSWSIETSGLHWISWKYLGSLVQTPQMGHLRVSTTLSHRTRGRTRSCQKCLLWSQEADLRYLHDHTVPTIPRTTQMFSFVCTRNPRKLRSLADTDVRACVHLVSTCPRSGVPAAEGRRLLLKVLSSCRTHSLQDTPRALHGLATPHRMSGRECAGVGLAAVWRQPTWTITASLKP